MRLPALSVVWVRADSDSEWLGDGIDKIGSEIVSDDSDDSDDSVIIGILPSCFSLYAAKIAVSLGERPGGLWGSALSELDII